MSKGKKPGRPREEGIELSDFEGPELGATAELIRELANLLRKPAWASSKSKTRTSACGWRGKRQHAKSASISSESHAEIASSPDGRVRGAPAEDSTDLRFLHPGVVKSPMVGTAYLAPPRALQISSRSARK